MTAYKMKKTIVLIIVFACLLTGGLAFIFLRHPANTLQPDMTRLSFINRPLTDPELPNYGRGAHYWNGVEWDDEWAPQVPEGNTKAKTGYRRFSWFEMESALGVYRFTGGAPSLEWHLKDLADKGMLLGYGSVMTAYDGGKGITYDGGVSQYPQYLHELMQSETTKDWLYNGRDWIPNWNSPSYLSRWRALQQAVHDFIVNWSYTPSSGPWAGKKVKGRDMLDWADCRGYGNFGEWHTWPWTKSTPADAIATDSTIIEIINATKDVFNDVPLHVNIALFDTNPWGDHNAFRAHYALTARNEWGPLGWRNDGIGDPGHEKFLIGNDFTYGDWRADTAIENRWQYAMTTGEPLNGDGSCCPYYHDVADEIANYHYAGMGNGNYGSRTGEVWTTMNEAFKLTGFRFNINEGYMSTTLSPNRDFQVSLNWQNVGASPLYQKRWRVVYQLKTAADEEVGKWVSKFNPFLFLPDSDGTDILDTLKTGNLTVGDTYKLTLKIEDATGLCEPLYLALNAPARNADGSYTLRSGIAVTGAAPVK
ncbi:MAG: hypothetical protein RL732_1474 [Bacteroidota bacterium]|jgi:hypothetical protein